MGNLETPEKIRNLQRKLYVKAKNELRYRFYLLYDKVYRDDILLHAYELAFANGGAPGVDGVDFVDIERGEGREAFLAKLKEELRTQTYQPKPIRRVYIPKPDGGQRPLGIPCIRDRVAQAAAKLVLEPVFEADFTDNAYGYRPKRSAHDAIKRVHELLRAGYTEVVDADLSKYFDTIPHRELMRSVARRVCDRKMLKLVKLWLKAPVEERDDEGRRKLAGSNGSGIGTPQGAVISPLLSNVYMRRFLLAWEMWKLPRKLRAQVVNYADDFVILCGHSAKEALEAAKAIIIGMKLTLNEEKTRTVEAWSEPFEFLGYTFGVCYSVGSGLPYLGAKPSKKRLLRFYGKIREFLSPGNLLNPLEAVQRLNAKLIGWSKYYSFGTLTKAYRTMDGLVVKRLRAWLCRREKVPGRGTRRYPDRELYDGYGLVRLTKLLATYRSQARRETSPRAGCGRSARPVR